MAPVCCKRVSNTSRWIPCKRHCKRLPSATLPTPASLCEGRKVVRFVGCNIGRIGRGDTGDNELFVDVDSTVDRINDFEHLPHPRFSIWRYRHGLAAQLKTSIVFTKISLRALLSHLLVLERASGTHKYSVSKQAVPTHLHVLCSVPVISR